jgi:23S rRNA pseudouridine2604 synthase
MMYRSFALCKQVGKQALKKLDDPTRMRLNKWLSAEEGLCSRREADRWIASGWIRVNGEATVTAPYFVNPGVDEITIDPAAHAQQSRQATILFHKPLGIVSSQPEQNQTPAIQLLTKERQHRRSSSKDSRRTHGTVVEPYQQKGWAVAGRLDINSTALLVLTQSGNIAQQLVCPGECNNAIVEKEYLVRIPAVPMDELEERLVVLWAGMQEAGERLEATSVTQLHQEGNQLRFVLTAGKHHHIRRMCQAVNVPVQALKRVRIGSVVLGDLPLGKWRYLKPGEVF